MVELCGWNPHDLVIYCQIMSLLLSCPGFQMWSTADRSLSPTAAIPWVLKRSESAEQGENGLLTEEKLALLYNRHKPLKDTP